MENSDPYTAVDRLLQQEGYAQGQCWFSFPKHFSIDRAGANSFIDETKNGAAYILITAITIGSGIVAVTADISINNFLLVSYQTAPTTTTHNFWHLNKGPITKFSIVGDTKPVITVHYQFIKLSKVK